MMTLTIDSMILDEFLLIGLMSQAYLISSQKSLMLSLTHETLILQSIETVKVDGSGRYTFPGIFLDGEDPVGLAVFENAFFWANQTQVIRTSPRSPKERQVLLQASVSALLVLHKSQQPKSK